MTAKSEARPGRNEPCHCGSGRKYKQCCLEKDEKAASDARAKVAAAAAVETPEPAEETAAAKPKLGYVAALGVGLILLYSLC